VLRVVGRRSWRYPIAGPQGPIAVTFAVGDSRWCAEFRPPFRRNRVARVVARTARAPAGCPCETFPSTFAAIETGVFERRGCTEAPCHGAAAQGDLDLRRGRAYAALVDVPSARDGTPRVAPGEPERSLLWRKLAAATLGLAGVPGTPMPSGLPPLPAAELEALRLWIRAGAPAEGVVAGTEARIGSCLPPPDPIDIRPPAPPAADEGVQLHGPPWRLEPHGEDEVCYATYYDFSATVPAGLVRPCPPDWGGPAARCFGYRRLELTQDPGSHHSFVHAYKGAWALTDPAAGFGPFTCRGGPMDGSPCVPTGIGTPAPAGADCGPEGGCAGTVVSSVACLGYGPPDFSANPALGTLDLSNSPTLFVSTEPVLGRVFPPGVYAILPVKGVIVWNSHAFNLTERPATQEQWLNLWFTPPDAQQYPMEWFPAVNDVEVENVPPFEKREYCRTMTFALGTRLIDLSSHTHRRGELFRIWGPGIAAECSSATGPCAPEPGPPIFLSTDYADPTVLVFDPPLALDGASAASRRVKYCARYDNGADDPTEVKRRSTSPAPPFPVTLGGPCGTDTVACLGGPRRGQPCGGDDRACDSRPGAHDGVCDACPLRGGVTTEDEMFLLLGSAYRVDGAAAAPSPGR
jgi:hypothetical protein